MVLQTEVIGSIPMGSTLNIMIFLPFNIYPLITYLLFFLNSWIILFYFYYFYSFYLKLKNFFLFFNFKIIKKDSFKFFLFLSFILNFFNFSLRLLISGLIYFLWFIDHEDILSLERYIYIYHLTSELIYIKFFEFIIFNTFFLVLDPMNYYGSISLFIITKYYL